MDEDAVTKRLQELAEQHRAGAISDAEYAAGKRALLGSNAIEDLPQETLVLRAVEDAEPATNSRRSLLLLVAAVGLVILVLAIVVWLGSQGIG